MGFFDLERDLEHELEASEYEQLNNRGRAFNSLLSFGLSLSPEEAALHGFNQDAWFALIAEARNTTKQD